MTDLYSTEAQERRDRFNNVINGIDMILMNNIPEVDQSVWENWEDKSPTQQTPCEWFLNDSKPLKRWCCDTHMFEGDDTETEKEFPTAPDYDCAFAEGEEAEVYQWFAVGDNDADFLKRHNQYVTYSDKLDTYFLAICHFGTSWDYVESMVSDILGDNE